MTEDDLPGLSPFERVVIAASLMDEHRAAMRRLSKVRTAALREARANGWKVIDMAKAIGVSRQAVYEILGKQ